MLYLCLFYCQAQDLPLQISSLRFTSFQNMDNVSAPFSVAITTSAAYSSSNVNLLQQNMGHPQNAHFLFDEQLSISVPYFVPYDESLQFPYMDTFQPVNQPLAYPVYSFPIGQSSTVFCGMPPDWQSQNEERKKGAMMSKIARDRRKQARQRIRSSASGASSIVEETRRLAFTSTEDNVQKNTTENKIPDTLYSLDGKRLKKLLTKTLKGSDVGLLGRIVLPKKEAEENLPALSNKEGIQVLLKDVYTDRQWSLKYKYWCNNRSRMYVLENTGDFVLHYELQIGDSLTLYEDEFKNLYVLAKKEQAPEVAESLSSREGKQQGNTDNYSYIHSPYSHQAKDEEEEASLAILIDELNHKEQESADNLFTMCSVGASSCESAYNKISQEISPNITTNEGALGQVAPTSSSQGNHDDLFGGLGMSELGCNFLLNDHVTDDMT